jgi:hypothetical protein
MGAYIYRLRGKRHFKEMFIEGKKEKVYDLVYWYKPCYSLWNEKEPTWMKSVRLFGGRLKSMFKNVEVKYARPVYINKDGTRSESCHVLEWRKGMVEIMDDPDWQGLKQIKL